MMYGKSDLTTAPVSSPAERRNTSAQFSRQVRRTERGGCLLPSISPRLPWLSASVWRRSLDVIDDHRIDGGHRGLEFQPKLLLDRRKNGRRIAAVGG